MTSSVGFNLSDEALVQTARPRRLQWPLLLAKSELLRDCTCCALDYICNLLGMRHIAAMAGACDFDCVAPGPLGIPTLQVRVDGSIAS
jgi:hypothetical protein